MNMPPKKLLPEGLIAQLHGKGSMSEVLRIERQRLMEQAAEEMRAQLGASAPKTGTAAAAVAVIDTHNPDTYQPSKLPVVRRSQEGLSKQSRFVGEDLSEFDGIITHTEQTIATTPEWTLDPYYVDV